MAAQLAERDAHRLRAPSWRDPRLIIGILLVLGSVVAGARLVNSFDDRAPVYAAAVAIRAGQVIQEHHLSRVGVVLGDRAEHYLDAGAGLPAGTVAVREVRAGELLPRSAIGRATHPGKPVMVPVDQDAARLITVGEAVDVWVNTRRPGAAGGQAYGRPVKMLSQVAVSRVPEAAGRGGVGAGTVGVHIVVPDDQVERVIEAVDQQARFTLVPVVSAVPLGSGTTR
ncbi:MAG: hypothetical protein IPI32_11575 [Austwickia sp.]|nr:hypothetical protein [Austwickia sp.]MBK8435879.1 hypothetical protein [Austwickia sp.]MBK9101565.1 hypothetical protein [Austwickia sp.]